MSFLTLGCACFIALPRQKQDLISFDFILRAKLRHVVDDAATVAVTGAVSTCAGVPGACTVEVTVAAVTFLQVLVALAPTFPSFGGLLSARLYCITLKMQQDSVASRAVEALLQEARLELMLEELPDFLRRDLREEQRKVHDAVVVDAGVRGQAFRWVPSIL